MLDLFENGEAAWEVSPSEAARIARARYSRPIARTATVPGHEFLLGLDLGALQDYTALAVVRKSPALDADGKQERSASGSVIWNKVVVHLERYPLGTSYPGIVRAVADLLLRPELPAGCKLVIDATGVGRPVVDMFRETNLSCELNAVTITAGTSATMKSHDEWNVAKMHLIGAAQAALSSGRLKFAKRMDHSETMKHELLNYRVKITAAANEVFEARSGKHDDLVLALCLPLWFAEYGTYSAGAF